MYFGIIKIGKLEERFTYRALEQIRSSIDSLLIGFVETAANALGTRGVP